jgi:hypothetical protein
MNVLVSTPAAQAIIAEAIAIAATVADELIEAFEREIMVRAGEMIQQFELLDARDRWRQTGDAPPPAAGIPTSAQPYRTARSARSTVDAFLYVASLDNPDYLARWLDQHPRDEKFLCKLWKKAKHAAEA